MMAACETLPGWMTLLPVVPSNDDGMVVRTVTEPATPRYRVRYSIDNAAFWTDWTRFPAIPAGAQFLYVEVR